MKVDSYVLLGRTPHLPFLGMEGPEDFRLVEQVLEQFDLSTLGQRTLESLSGGELQRCHLARVIAQSTPIIFLDEPTTALDCALTNLYRVLLTFRLINFNIKLATDHVQLLNRRRTINIGRNE